MDHASGVATIVLEPYRPGGAFGAEIKRPNLLDPLLELLAGAEDVDWDALRRVVERVTDDLRSTCSAAAVAILTENVPDDGLAFRYVARATMDGPPATSLRDLAHRDAAADVVADVAACVGVSAGRVYGVPLPRGDRDVPIGWLVAGFEREAVDSDAIAALQRVAWGFSLALRDGWGVTAELADSEREMVGLELGDNDKVVAAPRAAPPPPAAAPPAAPQPSAAAPRVDENVQFTVYRPRRIAPSRWYSVLAFAHLSERRPDAPKDAPDPLAEVRRQAQQVLGADAADFADATSDARLGVPAGGDLSFVLDVPELKVNPAQRTFRWSEDVHREEFRIWARPELDGRTLRGVLIVYLGTVLIADVTVVIQVDASAAGTKEVDTTSGRRYRAIFPSYSHKDAWVVQHMEETFAALGDRYLRDVTTLRAGELWSERLKDFIREADVFQLFWSRNSMESAFVRQEWEYALELQKSDFIRPTYWEEPLPAAPDRGLPPPAIMALHFYRLPLEKKSEAEPETASPHSEDHTVVGKRPPRVDLDFRLPRPAERPRPTPSARPPSSRPRWHARRLSTVAMVLVVALGGGILLRTGGYLGPPGTHDATEPSPPPPVPAPPPPPPPAPATKIRDFPGPNFRFNDAVVPEDSDRLDDAVRVLRDKPSLNVSIEGHADASEGGGVRLSERRAAAVRDWFVAHGIAPSRLTTRGFGPSRPIASNDTREGRAQNRRVEIVVE